MWWLVVKGGRKLFAKLDCCAVRLSRGDDGGGGRNGENIICPG